MVTLPALNFYIEMDIIAEHSEHFDQIKSKRLLEQDKILQVAEDENVPYRVAKAHLYNMELFKQQVIDLEDACLSLSELKSQFKD